MCLNNVGISKHGGGIADALSQYERKKPNRESGRVQRSQSIASNLQKQGDRPVKPSPLQNPTNLINDRRATSSVLRAPNPQFVANQADTAKDESGHGYSKRFSPRDGRFYAARSAFGSTHTLPALELTNTTGGSPIQFLVSFDECTV